GRRGGAAAPTAAAAVGAGAAPVGTGRERAQEIRRQLVGVRIVGDGSGGEARQARLAGGEIPGVRREQRIARRRIEVGGQLGFGRAFLEGGDAGGAELQQRARAERDRGESHDRGSSKTKARREGRGEGRRRSEPGATRWSAAPSPPAVSPCPSRRRS